MFAQNVLVPIVCAHFEEHVIRPVPLIQEFFYNVQSLAEVKPNRSLISFSTRIAFHLDLHTPIVTGIPGCEAPGSETLEATMAERPCPATP